MSSIEKTGQHQPKLTPKVPKLPSQASRTHASTEKERKELLTFEQKRGIGFVGGIAMKGLLGYRLLIGIMIIAIMIQTFTSWTGWDNFIFSIWTVAMVVEVVAGLIYIGLMLSLRSRDLLFQGKNVFFDVDTWRITSFWTHMRENVMKEILTINGLVIAVSSLGLMMQNGIL